MPIERSYISQSDIAFRGDKKAPEFGGRPLRQPTAEDISFINNNPDLPIGKLCRELGISRNTLRRWRREGAIVLKQRPHGRPPRPVSDPNFMVTIAKLHGQGLSIDTIAKEVRAGYNTVSRNLQKK